MQLEQAWEKKAITYQFLTTWLMKTETLAEGNLNRNDMRRVRAAPPSFFYF